MKEDCDMNWDNNKFRNKNKRYKKLVSIILCVIIMIGSFALTGCGSITAIPEIKEYISEVSTIKVPDNIKIVGLGEATHGNKEFQELKLEVFQALVENNDCRIFAIEGDFGGGIKVNEYISGGEGIAAEAVAQIGFGIYKTEEMEALVQWMHDYNETASEDGKLRFYGFDMQRYDNSKESLFSYLEQVDSGVAEQYRTLLADLTDETAYTQDKNKIKVALTETETLILHMEENKDNYIKQLDEKQYELAYECAQSIKENATIQGTSVNYSQTRDEYMKNKVDWILNYEENQMIFITGHNGHIEKTSATSYTSMGNRLADDYGNEYYTIGTDFLKITCNVVTTSGKSKVMTLKNENSLSGQFRELEGNVFFLDFEAAGASAELDAIINEKQSMANIGAEFNGWQKISKMFYTIKMVPAEAYDAVIVVKEATPSTKE